MKENSSIMIVHYSTNKLKTYPINKVYASQMIHFLFLLNEANCCHGQEITFGFLQVNKKITRLLKS